MAQWIEDPQGRPEVEKVTKELKLPVWKANHKGKFRDFWNELWDKIEDYVVKLKGDTEKKSKGLNDRLVSAVGKHDGDFPISNAVVGDVYYSELTKKYYKCKIGGPAPMPNGNFIDLSIFENLNRLENLITFEENISLKVKVINVVLPPSTPIGQSISAAGIPKNTVYITGFLFNYIKEDATNIYDYWDLQISLPSNCIVKKKKEYNITGYATVLAFYK